MKKKIHKIGRSKTKFYGIQVRPLCKVDNKTYAYKTSTTWGTVDCKRCLKFKEQIKN